MSKKEKKKEIKKIVNKIKNYYHPEKVILFGSHAYGTPHIDSDIDLAIIKNTKKRFQQRNVEARLLLSESAFPIDILVFTPAEFSINQDKNPLIQEIATKGIVMYEK